MTSNDLIGTTTGPIRALIASNDHACIVLDWERGTELDDEIGTLKDVEAINYEMSTYEHGLWIWEGIGTWRAQADGEAMLEYEGVHRRISGAEATELMAGRSLWPYEPNRTSRRVPPKATP